MLQSEKLIRAKTFVLGNNHFTLYMEMEFRHRFKSKLVAWISLVVWISEASWNVIFIIAEALGYTTVQKSTVEDPYVYNFPILMNEMGWNMALPLVYSLYGVTFIAQIGVSCILINGCKADSSLKVEEAACHCWSRISIFSIVTLISVYIFRPVISIYPFHLIYLFIRIVFQLLGILIVKLHARETKVAASSESHSTNPMS